MSASSSSSNFNHGYPTPGPQEPTGSQVMDHVFFVSNTEWKRVREEEKFDYIVIGTGFCALAFIDKVLQKNPDANILVLERGPFFLPEHFQNLPLPYQQTLGGLSETFPWTLSARTHKENQYIKWQHGMVPFFGGRSTLWSSWCPRPNEQELEGWPEEVRKVLARYFAEAEQLLNVIPANKIDEDLDTLKANQDAKQQKNRKAKKEKRPVFSTLQKGLQKRLQENQARAPSVTRFIPAPLAVKSNVEPIDFSKFSTPGPLLTLLVKQHQREQENRSKGESKGLLRMVTQCTVQRILQQGGEATALETSRGVVTVGDAKVILAMGTVPTTTLILNSFPKDMVPGAGEHFTAHFISSITARVRRDAYTFGSDIANLELAALYVAGEEQKGITPNKKNNKSRPNDFKGQYHIQLSALADQDPKENQETAARHMPDVVATASMKQLVGSEKHIVFVCAVLGEMEYENTDSWVRIHEPNGDPTANVILQVKEHKADLEVWETMDQGTFDVLEKVLSPRAEDVEYWHTTNEKTGDGEWRKERPSEKQRRVDGLVHEGSTLAINKVVGLDYRPGNVQNVYVTGASLWPRSGSWNPTLSMVALAQDLAAKLVEKTAMLEKANEAVR